MDALRQNPFGGRCHSQQLQAAAAAASAGAMTAATARTDSEYSAMGIPKRARRSCVLLFYAKFADIISIKA